MMPPLPPIGERSVRKRVLDFCQSWLADPLALSSSGFLENYFRFGTILNWPRDSPLQKKKCFRTSVTKWFPPEKCTAIPAPQKGIFSREQLFAASQIFFEFLQTCFFKPFVSGHVYTFQPQDSRCHSSRVLSFLSQVDMEPHFQNYIACRCGCISSCSPRRCLQMSSSFCLFFSELVVMRKSFAESSNERWL